MDAIPAWVDGRLMPVGKLEAHRRGLRHKAVSVFLFCGDALLIQRRALGKYHSGGLWANTCCSHPRWGEDAADCAVRRLHEELGLSGVTLVRRDSVEYRADVGNGLIEHEQVAVFAGRLDAPVALSPDVHEVMETRWAALGEIESAMRAAPETFAQWFRIYMVRGVIHGTAEVGHAGGVGTPPAGSPENVHPTIL